MTIKSLWKDFLKSKNDKDENDDQNFIKQGDEEKEPHETSEDKNTESSTAPKSNKQRNLHIENGGLEAKQDKGKPEDDLWDDRGEEIADMSPDIFNTTGMKSVVWKKKKERIDLKKDLARDSAEAVALSKKGKSFTDKVKSSRQNSGNDTGIIM